jgi:hypothetical protein
VFARTGLPMRKRRDGGVLHLELELEGRHAMIPASDSRALTPVNPLSSD